MLIFLNLITFLFVLSIPTMSYVSPLNYVVILLGFILGVVFLVTVLLGRYPITVPREFVIYLIWLSVCVASSIAAKDIDLTLAKLLTLCQIAVMFLILFNVCLWNKNIAVVLYPFFLAVIVNIPIALYQYHTGHIERPVGLTHNANMLGLLMVLGLFAISFFYLTETYQKKVMRIFKYTLFPLFFLISYVALLSGSKKALGGVGFGVLGFIYAYSTKIRSRFLKFTWIPILGIILAVFLVNVLSQSLVEHRFETALDFFKEKGYKSSFTYDSTSLRYAYTIAGLKMFKENPILGVGLNNFSKNVKKYSPMLGIHKTYAHNNYVEILACTGLLGFVTYFSMYLSIILRICQNLKNRADLETRRYQALLLLVFGFLLFFDAGAVTYYGKIPWIWFSIIISANYQGNEINRQHN